MNEIAAAVWPRCGGVWAPSAGAFASGDLASGSGRDKVLIWKTYLYVACTMIASSHVSDDQKWERWVQLSTLVSGPIPGPAAAAPAAAPAPAAATPADICGIDKQLRGPDRAVDANGGFNVDGAVLQVRNCRAMFHWTASARQKGCGVPLRMTGPGFQSRRRTAATLERRIPS